MCKKRHTSEKYTPLKSNFARKTPHDLAEPCKMDSSLRRRLLRCQHHGELQSSRCITGQFFVETFSNTSSLHFSIYFFPRFLPIAVMYFQGGHCSTVLIFWWLVFSQGGENRMLERDSEVFQGSVDLMMWDCKISLHMAPNKHTPDYVYDSNSTVAFSESALLCSCWDLPPFWSLTHICKHILIFSPPKLRKAQWNMQTNVVFGKE